MITGHIQYYTICLKYTLYIYISKRITNILLYLVQYI